MAASLLALAGCGGTSVSEVPSELELPSREETLLLFEDVATSVPLVLEEGSGKEIYSNALRNQENPPMPVPELLEGRNLTLTSMVVREGFEITVTWGYKEDASLAEFTFEVEEGKLTAIPGYEEFVPQENIPAPNPKVGRLIATYKLGEVTKSYNYDMFVFPVEKIDYYSLATVRDVTGDNYVGVRGYITGIFEDWNNGTIANGKFALGLFKLGDYSTQIKVGDYVDVVGKFTAYNGLNQLQFIRSVKVIDPATDPDARLPIVSEFTMDELAEQLALPGTGSEAMLGKLYDYDGAIVKFNAPFKFKGVVDRNNEPITLATMDVSQNVHYDVILEGTTSTSKKFEVKVAINYHLGSKRVAIKQFFVDNQTSNIYYEGHIGWYNVLNFAPYDVTPFSTTAK